MAKDENTLIARELRERNDSELQSLLGAKAEELYKVGFKRSLGQLRETHVIKRLRKDIARIRTVLAERQTKGEA